MTTVPKVKILMSTYNGAIFLQEQLESINKQVGVDIDLFVRDDGSTDDTKSILTSNDINLWPVEGEEGNLGPAKSFLQLIKSVNCEQYVALADQDDIWYSDKLLRAVTALKPFDSTPAMYCSNVNFYTGHQSHSTNSNLPLPVLPLSLFQNSAMGCTIVFNNKAHQIIQQSSGHGMLMHDWYILLLILSTGKVIFDPLESMLYRLHPNQAIGWKRKRSIWNVSSKDSFSSVLIQAQTIYLEFADQMTSESQEIFKTIFQIRDAGIVKRCFLLFGRRLVLRRSFLENAWTKFRFLVS
jgi:glycosyltransferase involved in cell wall biosynthesis